MKHGRHMPGKETLQRAGSDRAQGKSPSTQLKPANLFARKCTTFARVNLARAPQQAIATGLCKARRAGVKLSAPKRGRSSAKVRKQAQRG